MIRRCSRSNSMDEVQQCFRGIPRILPRPPNVVVSTSAWTDSARPLDLPMLESFAVRFVKPSHAASFGRRPRQEHGGDRRAIARLWLGRDCDARRDGRRSGGNPHGGREIHAGFCRRAADDGYRLQPMDRKQPAHRSGQLVEFCVLAARTDGQCRWCASELPHRRKMWCSDRCADRFWNNHWWTLARRAAKRRDRYRCKRCGHKPPPFRSQLQAFAQDRPSRSQSYRSGPRRARDAELPARSRESRDALPTLPPAPYRCAAERLGGVSGAAAYPFEPVEAMPRPCNRRPGCLRRSFRLLTAIGRVFGVAVPAESERRCRWIRRVRGNRARLELRGQPLEADLFGARERGLTLVQDRDASAASGEGSVHATRTRDIPACARSGPHLRDGVATLQHAMLHWKSRFQLVRRSTSNSDGPCRAGRARSAVPRAMGARTSPLARAVSARIRRCARAGATHACICPRMDAAFVERLGERGRAGGRGAASDLVDGPGSRAPAPRISIGVPSRWRASLLNLISLDLTGADAGSTHRRRRSSDRFLCRLTRAKSNSCCSRIRTTSFVAPWIVDQRCFGWRVLCATLTDGGVRTRPAVREAESRAALLQARRGPGGRAVPRHGHGVPDGALIEHLERVDPPCVRCSIGAACARRASTLPNTRRRHRSRRGIRARGGSRTSHRRKRASTLYHADGAPWPSFVCWPRAGVRAHAACATMRVSPALHGALPRPPFAAANVAGPCARSRSAARSAAARMGEPD